MHHHVTCGTIAQQTQRYIIYRQCCELQAVMSDGCTARSSACALPSTTSKVLVMSLGSVVGLAATAAPSCASPRQTQGPASQLQEGRGGGGGGGGGGNGIVQSNIAMNPTTA